MQPAFLHRLAHVHSAVEDSACPPASAASTHSACCHASSERVAAHGCAVQPACSDRLAGCAVQPAFLHRLVQSSTSCTRTTVNTALAAL